MSFLIWIGPYINHIIFAWAIIAGFVLFLTCKRAKFINEKIELGDDIKFKIDYKKNVTASDDVFLTFVSLFPFWGMLGTVSALLGLDFSTDNNEKLISNFFVALTTTGWGLFCSILFKLIYSLVQYKIESAIELFETLVLF